MNHLAHLLLAGNDPELQLGALLGDHVRGDVAASGYSATVRDGIVLHRKIDVWTDQHVSVAQARSLFQPPLRRYAGIMLDVYFDHLLSRTWTDHCELSLAAFNTRTLALLQQQQALLPFSLQRFHHYASATNVLARYAETAMLQQVFVGIGRRLSRANPLAQALPALLQHDDTLQALFNVFWPQLQQRCADWLLQAEHPIASTSASSSQQVSD
jgi:acyl carrier protein phosphodiesterase